jgi:hypothetical protein
MITQLEPSLTSSAQFPAVPDTIAVPAAPPARGTTLEDALLIACA